jgi:hypothetical protein
LWEDIGLTDYIMTEYVKNPLDTSFREEREHAIVMIYHPLIKLDREMIGEHFDGSSGSAMSWALDADSVNMRGRNA